VQEGLQVGQYVFIRKIGEGGMAEVWEAHHAFLGSRVAVKFLLPEFARNRELQERFLNEARRQAGLQHPNIVRAVDFIENDGRNYFVMQHVEGVSLDDRLKKSEHALTIDEIHSICWDVLSALDYAHIQGIVHRDVKPANMLVDESGRVLLTDFGIAKALREERSMTMTGTTMGTLDYMSPEQILATKNVDARADIYSFGCVLYSMLAGSPPFGSDATSPFVVQDRHVRAAPPPLVFRNSDVPAQVGDVVFKCLEKVPANRFQTCGAVMVALNAAFAAHPVELPDAAPDLGHPPIPADEARPLETVVEVGPPETAQSPRIIIPPVLPPGTVVPPERVKIESGVVQPQNPPETKRSREDKNKVDDAVAPKPSRTGLVIAITCIAIILLAVCGVAFWAMQPEHQRLKRLEARDWSQAHYDDLDFSNCMGVAGCLSRAAQASRLLALSGQGWSALSYNNPIFKDCMNYEPCQRGNAYAAQLLAVKDWRHDGKQFQSNCMNYRPCEESKLVPAKSAPGGGGGAVGEEDLPSCCKDAVNPARCLKKKEQEQIADCSSPIG
jgi:serine/threonine protein kinase